MNQDVLALMAKLNKTHGDGTVVVASDMRVAKRFTTGSLALDIALGGGWPGNQWSEVIGMESHGKTAVTLKTIAANQQLDPNFTTFWIAAEHYDFEQAEALGVDNSRVLVQPTQAMEFAFQSMLDFAASRTVDCIVLDSYPALVADEEAEKDMDEAVMALGARLTGKFFRKAGAATRRSMTDPEDRPILGLIINQYRDAIGQFSPHGTPKTTPGGKAKNFAFYTRIEVKRDDWIKESRSGKGQVNVGQTIKVKTIKNKSAAPQQVASLDFYFRDAPVLGFARGDYDEVKQLITYGVLFDVIERRGAWFTYGDERWQGRPAMEQAIRSNLTLQDELRPRILAAAAEPDKEHEEIDQEAVDAAANAGERKVKRRTAEVA